MVEQNNQVFQPMSSFPTSIQIIGESFMKLPFIHYFSVTLCDLFYLL